MDGSALLIWLVFSVALSLPTAGVYYVLRDKLVVILWALAVGSTWVIAFSITLADLAVT